MTRLDPVSGPLLREVHHSSPDLLRAIRELLEAVQESNRVVRAAIYEQATILGVPEADLERMAAMLESAAPKRQEER